MEATGQTSVSAACGRTMRLGGQHNVCMPARQASGMQHPRPAGRQGWRLPTLRASV